MQVEQGAVVVHVDCDLAFAMCLVRDTESVSDLDRVVEIRTNSQEGTKHAILTVGATEVVVQDGSEGHR